MQSTTNFSPEQIAAFVETSPKNLYRFILAHAVPSTDCMDLAVWEQYARALEAAQVELRANPERFKVGLDGLTPAECECGVEAKQ